MAKKKSSKKKTLKTNNIMSELSKSKSDKTSSQKKLKALDLDDKKSSKKENEVESKNLEPGAKSKDSKVKNKKSRKWLKRGAIAFVILILIPGLIVGAAALATYFPAKKIQGLVATTEVTAREAYVALKGQDLVTANEKLTSTKTNIETIRSEYNKLNWYKYTPFRAYYLDGEHAIAAAISGIQAGEIMLDTIEPYADVLGFSGEGSFMGGTAEDRIVKIVETLDKVVPELDKVATELTDVQNNLNQINPDRYPVEVKGREVSEWIEMAQEWSNRGVVAVTDVKPVLEALPAVAGLEEEKKYLILFQNDAEIRPTGGFMTAYGVLRVEKGKVSQEKSDDIYSLDDKFNSRIEAPEPIQTYLDQNYWFLRDMNLSPDYKESMELFLSYYKDLPGEPGDQIDGIVAVDTHVLTDLVRILGPIDVPGFGTFTADIDERCDCPQVIYELEDYATRPRAYIRTDRKAFLAPMLQTLLLKAYGADNEIWPQLFEIVVNNVMQKHVLFYMLDEEAQSAAEEVNIAGRVRDYDGDYFMTVNANMGGAKSNLFITEEQDHVITYENGSVTREVEITYRNPQKADNCDLEAGQLCLNGQYRDWVRFYLPEGAELVDSVGFKENSVAVSEDLGKTVVEGFFTLSPESQAKLQLTYTVPYVPAGETYDLLIQKQPGKVAPKFTVTYNNIDRQEFEQKTDQEVSFEL